MKIYKASVVLLTVILLALAFVPNARTEWLGGEDSEFIVLIRVDTAPPAPLHETDHGIYGYYTATGAFVTMINLNCSNPGPVAPYTWDDVKWVPGPLDADTTGGTQ